ncbi:MAG TPA: AAA family ATPase [Thermoanaerobaculia bacterium]
MRIAVSGTHCSGKTTLVEDFLQRHPEYVHEPEPYEWLAEAQGAAFSAEPCAADVWQQLELSVERLSTHAPGSKVIAERSPLDFLAYLEALLHLGREDTSRMLDEARVLVRRGLTSLDLVVVLPLNDEDGIETPESEDPELRQSMNVSLLEVIENEWNCLSSGHVRLAEITGTRQQRVVALESALAAVPLES